MTRHPSSGQRGLTLTELLVAMLLVGVVLFAAGSLYLSTERSFDTGSRKLLAQQESTLLAKTINRGSRVGSGFQVYVVPEREVPADSGNGLAILDRDGAVLRRYEWSDGLETLVDAAGNRVTSMKLQGVLFKPDPINLRTLHYRFRTDDEKGNLVDIESAVSLRN
jgi:prepilin-type N-terminal cleavage/methylation domain-containing protein